MYLIWNIAFWNIDLLRDTKEIIKSVCLDFNVL